MRSFIESNCSMTHPLDLLTVEEYLTRYPEMGNCRDDLNFQLPADMLFGSINLRESDLTVWPMNLYCQYNNFITYLEMPGLFGKSDIYGGSMLYWGTTLVDPLDRMVSSYRSRDVNWFSTGSIVNELRIAYYLEYCNMGHLSSAASEVEASLMEYLRLNSESIAPYCHNQMCYWSSRHKFYPIQGFWFVDEAAAIEFKLRFS